VYPPENIGNPSGSPSSSCKFQLIAVKSKIYKHHYKYLNTYIIDHLKSKHSESSSEEGIISFLIVFSTRNPFESLFKEPVDKSYSERKEVSIKPLCNVESVPLLAVVATIGKLNINDTCT
jgi:hypothetical protein